MRKILFVAISLLIAISTITWNFPPCNIQTIKQDFAPKIFIETTVDGVGQNVSLTRFLHNKVGIHGAKTASCYFTLLDPSFIYKNLGILTVLFLAFFAYKAIERKYWLHIAAFLVAPILLMIPTFPVAPFILVIAYKIFAIMGLAYFLKLR